MQAVYPVISNFVLLEAFSAFVNSQNVIDYRWPDDFRSRMSKRMWETGRSIRTFVLYAARLDGVCTP